MDVFSFITGIFLGVMVTLPFSVYHLLKKQRDRSWAEHLKLLDRVQRSAAANQKEIIGQMIEQQKLMKQLIRSFKPVPGAEQPAAPGEVPGKRRENEFLTCWEQFPMH